MNRSWKFAGLTAGLALAVATLTAAPAAAQEHRAELSAGYQYTHIAGEDDGDGLNMPGGWYVDVAGTVKPMFQVVGEVSGAYKSEDASLGVATASATLKLHTFMGGLRVAAKGSPKVTPYGQILFGAAHGSGGFSASAAGTSIDVSDSSTEFAMQLGAGVNAMVTPNFGLRVGADYRRILTNGGENEFRVIAGVIVPVK